MTGLTLDAGALIAVERRDQRIGALIESALAADESVDVPAGVLAQVWRGGPRQANLARVLSAEGIGFPAIDRGMAEAIGMVVGLTGHPDVVDVHVAVNARIHGHAVVTSDPADIRAVDPALDLIVI